MAEGAVAGVGVSGAGGGGGAGAKVGEVMAGIVAGSWAETTVDVKIRIRLSKMREQGDICIYYLYISERNETRFNRRE